MTGPQRVNLLDVAERHWRDGALTDALGAVINVLRIITEDVTEAGGILPVAQASESPIVKEPRAECGDARSKAAPSASTGGAAEVMGGDLPIFERDGEQVRLRAVTLWDQRGELSVTEERNADKEDLVALLRTMGKTAIPIDGEFLEVGESHSPPTDRAYLRAELVSAEKNRDLFRSKLLAAEKLSEQRLMHIARVEAEYSVCKQDRERLFETLCRASEFTIGRGSLDSGEIAGLASILAGAKGASPADVRIAEFNLANEVCSARESREPTLGEKELASEVAEVISEATMRQVETVLVAARRCAYQAGAESVPTLLRTDESIPVVEAGTRFRLGGCTFEFVTAAFMFGTRSWFGVFDLVPEKGDRIRQAKASVYDPMWLPKRIAEGTVR